MPDSERYRRIARAAKERLETEPTLTVPLLASALDATVDEVQTVLDEFRPTSRGVSYRGPGQGGPWVEPVEAA